MKIVIAYAGKTGTTEKCANLLKEKLADVEVIDISKTDVNIEEYDFIVLGASIRMGIIPKQMKKFIQKNQESLLTKKTAIYLCCAFIDGKDNYFTSNFPTTLLEKSIIYDTFGGELEVDRQKGFDKFITNIVSKSIDPNHKIQILPNKINAFAEKIKRVER